VEQHAVSCDAGQVSIDGSGADVQVTGNLAICHGADGLGKAHASCARKCIQSGLPVALKVGDQLYLAAMNSHDPANKTLAAFAGERVTVRGQVMEKDGQHLIAISRVEKTE